MRNLYPEKLEKFILAGNIYIPRKIKQDEHLKLYKRYWLVQDDEYLKVDQVYSVEDQEYYSVKYLNGLYGEISFPLNHNFTYELFCDKKNVTNMETILNQRYSFTGAEIKFWFFIHNIDLEEEMYNGFISFLDPDSKSLIADDKHYFLKAKLDEGIYKDCKIFLDREKELRIYKNERRNQHV